MEKGRETRESNRFFGSQKQKKGLLDRLNGQQKRKGYKKSEVSDISHRK